MALSNDLVSEFVQITNDTPKSKTESTVYGTIVESNGEKYIKIDGSDILTPISSTTNVKDGERVMAMVKNHEVVVTGNLSSPAARTEEVEEVASKIAEFEIVIVDKVNTKELDAANARIENLEVDNVKINETLTAAAADIEKLEADNITVKDTLNAAAADITDLKAQNVEITGKLTARDADIDSLQADNLLVKEQLTAQDAEINDLKADNVTINEKLTARDADIEDLKADNVTINEKLTAAEAEVLNLKSSNLEVTNKLTAAEADIDKLTADNVEVNEKLTAQDAEIEDLKVNKLSAKDIEGKYANIDFSNIKMAAVAELFTKSGIIKDLVVGDQSITGELVGVTLKGDLIEAGTVKADKLVVKGSDGLFYKLNVTAGGIAEGEEVPTDTLHGSVITAKSIVAEKIDVKDLVAFGATIGGFHISDHAIFSGVKESVDNTTAGSYLDDEGQVALGDASNYIKVYKDENGAFRIAISAAEFIFSTSNKSIKETIDDIHVGGRNIIRNSKNLMFDDYAFVNSTDYNAVLGRCVLGKMALRNTGAILYGERLNSIEDKLIELEQN